MNNQQPPGAPPFPGGPNTTPPQGAGGSNTTPPHGAGRPPLGNGRQGQPFTGPYGAQFAGVPPYGAGIPPYGMGAGVPPYGMPYNPYYKPKKMKLWQKLLLIVGIVVVSLGIIFGIANLLRVETNDFVAPGVDYLARISVIGEIGNYDDPYSSSNESYHHAWTMEQIDALIDDDYNRGLILYVDSPGGGVYESDELYLCIRDYQEQTGRPVYVYMGSMAASGGYYISAPADLIYANRNTWTGSIGVIVGTLFDVSEFLAEHGIQATDITSGANKGMGSYFEPLTDEQRAILQSMVDEAYDQFTDIVAEGRGMSVSEVKRIADGRIYTAKQAQEVGLIDGIATEEDALQAFCDAAGDPLIDVEDIVYYPRTNYFAPLDLTDYLLGRTPIGSNNPLTQTDIDAAASGDVSRVLELAIEQNDLRLKYMYG